MNGSESMLTYRKEDCGSTLVAGACSWTSEMRKALAHRRQAKDEPAERLFFNLLDGLAFDLEPIAPVTGQLEKRSRLLRHEKHIQKMGI
ncbi:hypothetical protein CD798_17330 [Bacillaceae bacterium SAOS 7]|nr:hypothetical protein CD798_17330 [Bacillaceae bacterium SAOS 7]